MSDRDPTPDGETALCGIVLHPAGHTRSPAMHAAAYAALGLDARYQVWDVPPDGLAAKLSELREQGIRQLSVSIPHKEAIIALLDEVDVAATKIGAVNTVVRRGDRLVGSNTDCPGALRALERAGSMRGRRAIVLGAGGAARAVVYGLVQAGASVTVLNRTVARAESLARDLGAESGPLEALAELDHDVLVNTTSVGLKSDESPVPASSLRAGSIVMDAVYDPPMTRLLRDAEAAGATTVGGKWMLVYQGALQLEAWAVVEAPVGVMADAFDAAG
jgi:shikimate dehydrogenase